MSKTPTVQKHNTIEAEDIPENAHSFICIYADLHDERGICYGYRESLEEYNAMYPKHRVEHSKEIEECFEHYVTNSRG